MSFTTPGVFFAYRMAGSVIKLTNPQPNQYILEFGRGPVAVNITLNNRQLEVLRGVLK